MDGSQFDRLARVVGLTRSRRAATALLGGVIATPLLAGSPAAGKKHKKKKKKTCAKTCRDGCCAGKKGQCIHPSQQSQNLCGAGGEICRSTGCPECTANRPCPKGFCCAGDGTCGPCLAFLTSTTQSGKLGGLTGGDAICQTRASVAGLPGTYMAWLTDGSASPSTRFTRAATAYTRVDGAVIADNWSDLTSGTLNNALNVTETGQTITDSSRLVWSNAFPDGTVEGTTANSHCAGWTSAAGTTAGNEADSNATNGSWSRIAIPQGCGVPNRLYCFQQR